MYVCMFMPPQKQICTSELYSNVSKTQSVCYLDTMCQRIPITTTQILLPAFNLNGQSLKLPNESGPTVSDHTKQHCCNKRLMITPEA